MVSTPALNHSPLHFEVWEGWGGLVVASGFAQVLDHHTDSFNRMTHGVLLLSVIMIDASSFWSPGVNGLRWLAW